MNIEDFLSNFDGIQKTGENQWAACCPAHDDRDPSLSISQGDKGIVLHCHAGCSVEEILKEVGLKMSDLFYDKKIVATYPYTDENGSLLYEVVRYEPKDFRQRRPDGKGGWIWNLEGVQRVLYRLPDLLKAKQKGLPIFIVEGEKDVHKLQEFLGSDKAFVTTNPGGAGKWLKEYSETLAGCKVVVIPDRDEPGKKHAFDVVMKTAPITTVGVGLLPSMPPKGDVSAWIDDHHTVEEFWWMINKGPWVHPSSKKRKSTLFKKLSDLINLEEEATDWVVDGLLPASGMSILTAKPKVGKSTLARQICLCIVQGKPFLGRETQKGSVAYLALEERESEVVKHFRAMGYAGDEEEVFIRAERLSENLMKELEEFLKTSKPKLLVIDPLIKIMHKIKDTDKYAEVYRALEPILDLARNTGTHVLTVHHAKKGETEDDVDSAIGSTAFTGTPDTILHLKQKGGFRGTE